MNKSTYKVYNLHKNNIEAFGGGLNKTCKESGYKKLPDVIPSNKYKRIIVIGDLHGDVQKTLKALIVAKVIDKKTSKWIGGKTAVVQIGDQLDGCRPTSDGDDCSQDENKDYADIRVMDILDRFHRKAVKKGGAIFSLIGNHEVMQEDDNRYISPKSYKYFNNYIDPESGKKFTSGKQARKFAFKPGNEYAVRLACTRNTALIIGSFLFVHAGVLPNLAENLSIDKLNKIIRDYLLGNIPASKNIKKIGTVRDLISNYNISPFWPRFFGQMKPNLPDTNYLCKKKLQPTLDFYEVNGMFVGHTPQFMYGRGINSTCSNKLWRVDVGMSDAFGKFGNNSRTRKVQVLQIKNDGADKKKDFSILTEV